MNETLKIENKSYNIHHAVHFDMRDVAVLFTQPFADDVCCGRSDSKKGEKVLAQIEMRLLRGFLNVKHISETKKSN